MGPVGVCLFAVSVGLRVRCVAREVFARSALCPSASEVENPLAQFRIGDAPRGYEPTREAAMAAFPGDASNASVPRTRLSLKKLSSYAQSGSANVRFVT